MAQALAASNKNGRVQVDCETLMRRIMARFILSILLLITHDGFET